MYGGVPPPPPSSVQPSSLPSVCPAPAPAPESLPLALAPPPGFSDSEHSEHSELSDTDSLGSEPNNFQRFGFSRVSKPRSLAVARQDRMMPQVNSHGGGGGGGTFVKTETQNTMSLLKSSENIWKYACKFSHEHSNELFTPDSVNKSPPLTFPRPQK